MKIAGTVAVVTGAGSGIGRQLAIQLAGAGARVAINDWDADTLAETAETIEQSGGSVFARSFDVGSLESMQAFADGVGLHYGQADIMVNNAGVALGRMNLDQISYADFQWIVNVNMWGVIHGTMAFLPLLRERPEASLVNVCSCFGLLAVPGQAPYCATKFAVRGFTDSIRLEVMDSQICVTLAVPSQVRTNIIRNGRHENESIKAELIKQFDEQMTKFSADEMAEAIIDGIERKREEILFGSDSKIFSFASRFLPWSVIKVLTRRELRKLEKEPGEINGNVTTPTD